MAEGPSGKVLGGSLLLKLLILIAVVLIASAVIVGFSWDPVDLISNILRIVVGTLILVLVLKGIMSLLKPKPFSPTESFQDKIIRMAGLTKPFNLKELYLRGEGMRVHSKIGKVVGAGWIPSYASSIVKDEDGEIEYSDEPLTDFMGTPIVDADGKTKKKPKRKGITEKDGDFLFVVKHGPFIRRKTELIRVNPKYLSDIGERTWIKTQGLMTVGDFWYPSQQCQEDIEQIQSQHKTEALVETHAHFLDLMANVTTMSLGSDPTFRKIIDAQTEILTSRGSGGLIQQ